MRNEDGAGWHRPRFSCALLFDLDTDTCTRIIGAGLHRQGGGFSKIQMNPFV